MISKERKVLLLEVTLQKCMSESERGGREADRRRMNERGITESGSLSFRAGGRDWPFKTGKWTTGKIRAVN